MQLTTSDNARCHAGMQRRPPGTGTPAVQTPDSNLPHEPPGNPIGDGHTTAQRHAPRRHAPTRSNLSAACFPTVPKWPNITKALAKQDKSHTHSGYWRPNISPIPRHHQQAQPPPDRIPMQECDSSPLRPARHSHHRTALPCKKVRTNRPLQGRHRATLPCYPRYPAPHARNSNSPAHHVCQSILTGLSHVSRTHVKRIRWYPEAPYATL